MAQAFAAIYTADAATFRNNERIHEEIFGPCMLVITCARKEELIELAGGLEGQLTATVHGTEADLMAYGELVSLLRRKAGRLIFNGFPTGVEVCPSMHHGGPYPATTDGRSTSVGTAAVYRFCRRICYQDFPQSVLPTSLQDANPGGILRLVDSTFTLDPV